MIMDSSNQRFKFFVLEKNKNHFCLFGIDTLKDKCYLLEAIEFQERSTSRYSIESARGIWTKLLKEGYKQIQLKDNEYLPHFLIEKIKQWSKFTAIYLKKIPGIESSDPWIIKEIKPEKKYVNHSETKQENYSYSVAWDYKDPFEIDWDNLGEPSYSDESRIVAEEDNGDFDNYWNQEGVFEEATDQSDQFF
tara:strand:- start:763 stop:1338 length:576 start_codon:yes stop_codon:yes gene_type:complete